MAKILVLDDEQKILKLIKDILLFDGHTVTMCSKYGEIVENELPGYDMILLDVMMPGMDGFDVCRNIRNKVDCPILFITAKAEEEDIVYGLGLGADDYISKPFGMDGLRARVNAHLRRENRSRSVTIRSGDIMFDLQGMRLIVGSQAVNLTKGEYQICEFLVRNKGQVFSREQIYEAVFGYDGESNDSTIATHIRNIRIKLDEAGVSPIQTVWGIGYKWER